MNAQAVKTVDAQMVKRFVSTPESPLEGVSNAAWSCFVMKLEVQAINAVSLSGGLGSYDIRPRRLVELGYAIGLQTKRNDKGRQIQTCSFILPWTQTRFLSEPVAQYVAFSKSISLYHRDLMSGKLAKPADASVASALAVLHVGGTGALKAWPDLFEKTRSLADAVRGAF